MEQQRTCTERIGEELCSTIKDLRECWDAYCGSPHEDSEYTEDSIFEYGLSFDYVPKDTFHDQEQGYFRYQLSWGGPADEFRFYVDYDGKPYKIEYWFLDWWDGANRTLTGEDEGLLLEIWNWFDEIGSVQKAYEDATE